MDAVIPYFDEEGKLQHEEAKVTQLSFLCQLCKGVIEHAAVDNFQLLGPYTFHIDCYEIALQRLSKFVDILCLPEDEWEKWLEDEDE